MRISVPRLAIALGLVLGLVHAAWGALVALGMAQPLLDFIFALHFIDPPYHVAPFDAGKAALLIALTATIGAVLGAIGGLIWNALRPRRSLDLT